MTFNEAKLEVVPLSSQEDEACRTFVIKGEDHTLGNSLRYMIMKNPEVDFCGYSVPHPSEERINFRIQTKGTPATAVLKQGLEDLNSLCEQAMTTFKKSVKNYKRSKKQSEEESTRPEQTMDHGSD